MCRSIFATGTPYWRLEGKTGIKGFRHTNPNDPWLPFLRMLRVKPDLTTRKVELSHRGLTYEVHAATAPSGMINVIREFGSSLREVPFSRIPEEVEVQPTPTSPSVIEFFHSQKNHITEPFTVTLTNTLYTGTVPPGKPTFLHRPPDTPLVAAVAKVSPMLQEAELTPEERSEILRNLDQQQSCRKTGWLPEIPASRPSEKIDHTKC